MSTRSILLVGGVLGECKILLCVCCAHRIKYHGMLPTANVLQLHGTTRGSMHIITLRGDSSVYIIRCMPCKRDLVSITVKQTVTACS